MGVWASARPAARGLYQYAASAEAAGVVDGDTLDVTLDLGLGVRLHNFRLRAVDYDAPELRTPEGVAAAGYLRALLGRYGGRLIVETFVTRADLPAMSFERYLARVWLVSGEGVRCALAGEMIAAGHGTWVPQAPRG